MKIQSKILLVIVAALMMSQIAMFIPPASDLSNTHSMNDISLSPKPRPVSPYMTSEDNLSQWTGESSGLSTDVYGNRTDFFEGNQMEYFPSNSSTNSASVSIPMGTDWDGQKVEVEFSNLRETRTWNYDPIMDDGVDDNWTLAVGYNNGAGAAPSASWVSDTHDGGLYAVQFEIAGGGDPGLGEYAYATQHISVPRGDVIWAGFDLDYSIQTDWGAEGFVSIYVTIEGTNYSERVWQMSFGNIGAENTWYPSGLIEIQNTSLFDLSDGVDVTVGLYSSYGGGYSPDLNPYAWVDNLELHLMTECAPTDITLEVDGLSVNNITQGPQTIYGSGYLVERPATTWKTSPVQLDITWTPTYSGTYLDPDRSIVVDFDVSTNLYSNSTQTTVKTHDPFAYGESFFATNTTYINYTTWFNVDPPDGYENRFYFNVSLPEDRDMYFVGTPGLVDVNYTHSWDESHGPAWYTNVSAFKTPGYWGFWLLESQGFNMITDATMRETVSDTAARSLEVRMDDTIEFTAHVGTGNQFEDASVNITVYDPMGSIWHSEIVLVNSSGYATSTGLDFDNTADAGDWTVSFTSTNSISGSSWNKTGFFLRSFKVVHSSVATLLGPADAVGTWIANVTYPDLFRIFIMVNDSDIPTTAVSDGVMTCNWTDGINTFGLGGNGTYLLTLDPFDLAQGQHIINIDWTHPHYDAIQEVLTVNINLPAAIQPEVPESPTVSGPVGDDITFTVKFLDYYGSGIDYGVFACNWSGSYSVTPVAGSPGSYKFILDGTGVELGKYVVEVTGTANFIVPQTYTVYPEFRELNTGIQYLQDVVNIPLGESSSFLVNWTDDDHGTQLTGMSSSISCNWTGNHVFGESNYSVSEISPGVYQITIYTYDHDTIGTHPVNVTLQGYLMQNQSYVVNVIIQEHNTDFRLDSPIQQTSHGDDIIVLVFYRDVDLGLGILNDTQDVTITVTSPGLPSLIYSSTDSALGAGHFNITIPTTQWATIGWKNLTISVSWTGTYQKYTAQVYYTSLRIVGRITDVYLDVAPLPTYYLDNFTFTIVYYDTIGKSGISSSTGYVDIEIAAVGNSVIQNDFYFFEIGTSGVYEFHLDTEYALDTGVFTFDITFKWAKGVVPLYENMTLTVNLYVLHRPTYIDFTPIVATPFGETAVYEFTYIDLLSATRIPQLGGLSITLNESEYTGVLSYDGLEQVYSFSIDTTQLNQVGSITLHLNVTWTGEPFYQSLLLHSFTFTVTLRATQLTVLPFTTGQFGDNVTMYFNYTDLVAGSTTGMVGDLTLNVTPSNWYTVIYLGVGQYEVVLNTSALIETGSYLLEATIVYTGANFASDASVIFGFDVLMRSTQLGFNNPDPAPYQSNVEFTITYTDDSSGSGVESADIIVTCSTSDDPLEYDTNYWVTYLGSGNYLVEVDTVALGDLQTYILHVVANRTSEYYELASGDITARVVERPTVIRVSKTPGETPFLELVTIEFRYEDFLTSTMIPLLKTDIILSHGPDLGSLIAIDSVNYTLTGYPTYYEISFNSTALDSLLLVSSHVIFIEIDMSALEPYYDYRNIELVASTTERSTQILFPLVDETPYFDDIIIDFEYIDFLSGAGIIAADIAVTSVNLTTPAYTLDDNGDGTYRISIPTEQFGDTGVVLFNIYASKPGVPHYSAREALLVPATVREVQTSLLAEVPAAGAVPVGDLIAVNLTLTDFDHNSPLVGAIVTTSWTDVTSRSVVVAEVGGGLYTLSLNTTGLVADVYVFTVQAEKGFYQTTNITVSVQPGAGTVIILLSSSIFYADWGEAIDIRFDVRETYYYALVPNMNISLLWNGTLFSEYLDYENGTYSIILYTSNSSFGIYEPQVSVSRQYYQTRTQSFTLIISKAAGRMQPSTALLEVVTDSSREFWVYLNDTVSLQPVASATVSVEFNNTVMYLTPHATIPGNYTGVIDVTGFDIGQYDLIVRAIATNHNFLDILVDVSVIPIPTSVALYGDEIAIAAFYGDLVEIRVVFNDTYYLTSIDDGNVSFVVGGYSGILFQIPDGSYVGDLDTSIFAAQSLYMTLTGTKPGYAIAFRTLVLNILPVPTEVAIIGARNQDAFIGDTLSFTFNMTDTHNNISLIDAEVIVDWEGPDAVIVNHGDGTYSISLNINMTLSKLYEIRVRFIYDNYLEGEVQVGIYLKPTPAEIGGPPSISIPVNDSVTVQFTVTSTLDNTTVSDLPGSVISTVFGELLLVSVGNGVYTLTIPDYLPMSIYQLQVQFSAAQYSIQPYYLNLEVRPIETILIYGNTTIDTQPGEPLTLTVQYLDLDHGIGLSGLTPNVTYDELQVRYYPNYTIDHGDGTYDLYFTILGARTFDIEVTFSKELYATPPPVVFKIRADPSSEALFIQTFGYIIGAALLLTAGLIGLYVTHFSTPKMLRMLNRMIKALMGGKVPSAADVSSRVYLVQVFVNEELSPVDIVKEIEDIAPEPIIAEVPEVDALLERLAEITGLGDEELTAFRADLSRMKASERPGFLKEVIEQEEARRAEDLATRDGVTVTPTESDLLEARPEELEEVRSKLRTKGMADSEIDVIIEQAKGLSKADLEALLESLGIRLD